MPGMKCQKCGRLTLFNTPTGKKCSNPDCNYEIFVPANNGKGGKGKRCLICNQNTVFDGKCRNCGSVSN